MNLTIQIPDELARDLAASGGDLSRRALEGFALEEYKSGRLTKTCLAPDARIFNSRQLVTKPLLAVAGVNQDVRIKRGHEAHLSMCGQCGMTTGTK